MRRILVNIATWTMMSVVVVGTVFFAVFLLGAGRAWPHEHYDAACCSNRDCKPIENKADEPEITPEGYLLKTGELVRYKGDNRLKHPLDDRFHVCRMPSGYPAQQLRCLYPPNNVF